MQSIFSTIVFIAAANAECVAQINIDTCVNQYRASIKSTCGMAATPDACYCQSLPALAACYEHCIDVPANAKGKEEVLRDIRDRCDAAKSTNYIPQPTTLPQYNAHSNQSDPAQAYVSDPSLNQYPTATTIPAPSQSQTMSSQPSSSSAINNTMSASDKTGSASSDSKSNKVKNVDEPTSNSASISYSAAICIPLIFFSQYL